MPTQELPEALEERAQLVHVPGQPQCFHTGSHEIFCTRPRTTPTSTPGPLGSLHVPVLKGVMRGPAKGIWAWLLAAKTGLPVSGPLFLSVTHPPPNFPCS